jgi:glutamate formiminotransferase
MTFEEAMAQFDAGRAKTAALAADADDLRTHVGDHPAFGALDAYGWVLFLSGHTERHTLQIEEIKADPAFPES